MSVSEPVALLVVEDQPEIAANIAQYMEAKGHILDFANTGPQGLALALANYYSIIVLDLNLPGMDGLEVCRQIRDKADRHIPILMLSARDSINDKVTGFHLGADDYLTKPFSLEELEVRCLALARRHRLHTSGTLTIGPLTLDRRSKSAARDGQSVNLTVMGFKILTLLAEAYPQVVSRSELSQKLWGDAPTESDALRSHMYQLRNALDKPFDYPLIKTVFGVGFTIHVNNLSIPTND